MLGKHTTKRSHFRFASPLWSKFSDFQRPDSSATGLCESRGESSAFPWPMSWNQLSGGGIRLQKSLPNNDPTVSILGKHSQVPPDRTYPHCQHAAWLDPWKTVWVDDWEDLLVITDNQIYSWFDPRFSESKPPTDLNRFWTFLKTTGGRIDHWVAMFWASSHHSWKVSQLWGCLHLHSTSSGSKYACYIKSNRFISCTYGIPTLIQQDP